MVVLLAVWVLLLHVWLVNSIDLDREVICDEGEMLYALHAMRLEQPLYRGLSIRLFSVCDLKGIDHLRRL